MNKFWRAFYVLLIEVLLAPVQLLALIGMSIYYFVDGLIDGYSVTDALEFVGCVWIGAWFGIKILIHYCSTGELDLDIEKLETEAEEYL